MGATTLAKTLQVLRREHGKMSQEDLANAAGLTWGTVSRVERGEVSPSLKTAQALARALGVTVDEIDWPQGKGTKDDDPSE